MQFCPRNDCHRAGDSLGTCVDKQTIGCASYREVDPKSMIVLKCNRVGCHGKTIAVSIHSIMANDTGRARCAADVATCEAFQVKLKAT